MENENKRNGLPGWVTALILIVGFFISLSLIIQYLNEMTEYPEYQQGGVAYPLVYEQNFMNNCMQKSSYNRCVCAYSQLENNYSFQQAQWFDSHPAEMPTVNAMGKIEISCAYVR